MKVRAHSRSESESQEDLRAALQGRVFHVTRLAALPEIVRSGAILPNTDRSLKSTFGYLKNGYFRNRGCVSLFDYRAEPTKDLDFHRSKCSPFQPATPEQGGLAILFVSECAYDKLIPWTQSRIDRVYSEQVVPYVEVGYQGPMSIDLIEEVVTLEVTEDPNSIMALYRRLAAMRRLDCQ